MNPGENLNLLSDVRTLAKNDARQTLMIDTAANTLRRFDGSRIFEIAMFAIDAADHAAQKGALAAEAEDRSLRNLDTPKKQEDVLRGHRVGVALWMALANSATKIPYRATNHQVFAALGLFLLKAAMLDSIGMSREMRLLDAAECIYAWQHLKPPSKSTALWRDALNAMLPKLVLDNGKNMPAKEALRVFVAANPSFEDDVENENTFGVALSRLRTAAKPK